MNTGRAEPNAPLSQERYVSSREYDEIRAISGVAVAKRCAILPSRAKRHLILFLQGRSLLEDGLKGVVNDLFQLFPDRFGTPLMHELGMKPGRIYTSSETARIEEELTGERHVPFPYRGEREEWEAKHERKSVEQLLADCRRMALESEGETDNHREVIRGTLCLVRFLIDLCVNPTLRIRLKTEVPETAKLEKKQVEEEFQDHYLDFQDADLVYFEDIVGALFDYKRQYEERVKREFCHTAISRQIWKQLDDALATKTMALLIGREGRGKTEAATAWFKCHLSVARFASLKGKNTKASHSKELARSMGIGHGSGNKVEDTDPKIEYVARTAELMVLADECQYLFSSGARVYGQAQMLDWLDCAFCNPPLPIALIGTPDILVRIERATVQMGWNYHQFQRRCKRPVLLPDNNTLADIEAVARHLLPGADKPTIKQIKAYVELSKRDLSALGDVIRETKLLAEQEGESKITYEHVRRAIYEVLLPGDKIWAGMAARIGRKLESKPEQSLAAVASETAQEAAETHGGKTSPKPLPAIAGSKGLRLRRSAPRMITAENLPVSSPALSPALSPV